MSFCIELFCVVTLQYQMMVRIAIAYFIIEKRKLRHSLGRPSRSDFVHSEFVEESNLLVLNKLERLLTVCKVKNIDDIDLSKEFYFIGKTDEEISLVCETNDVPENTIEREDGWRGFRIQGILDFSLIGILSKLSGILADNKIGIFAVSTFNTDYILVKDADFEKSLAVLLNAGYTVI